jgi:hypothetical protein
MLTLNSELAKAADNIVSGIKETGKYIGVITRAEKLTASTGTVGLGLSFKSDQGQTADYLDIWHTKLDGQELSGLKTVNAILCCAKVHEAKEGSIRVEKWNADKGMREQVDVRGYPELMGRRIGFLLQKSLETSDKGKDVERLQIFAVFNAETELTASEMYARKTNPERLSSMLDVLIQRPVRDNRKNKTAAPVRDDSDFYDGVPPNTEDRPF